MKIVKSQSMAGSGKHTKQRLLDAEPAHKMATIARALESRFAEIKRHLEECIDITLSSGDPVEVALRELAVDRYLAIYDDPAHALDTIHYDLRHIVQNRWGSLK